MIKLAIKHVDKVSKWVLNKELDSIDCQYTDDISIFYQMKKGDYSFFIEIFMNENGEEEASCLNIYKDEKLQMGGGESKLEDCLEIISSKLEESEVLVEKDRFKMGVKKYGYDSLFRKEYESLVAQLRHDELEQFFDKWNISKS